MNGRNEDQQQKPLPHRLEQRVAAASQQVAKDFIGRGVLIVIVVVAKFLDEFGRRRKRSQYRACNSKEPKLFAASVIAEFSDNAGLQPADETVAV